MPNCTEKGEAVTKKEIEAAVKTSGGRVDLVLMCKEVKRTTLYEIAIAALKEVERLSKQLEKTKHEIVSRRERIAVLLNGEEERA